MNSMKHPHDQLLEACNSALDLFNNCAVVTMEGIPVNKNLYVAELRAAIDANREEELNPEELWEDKELYCNFVEATIAAGRKRGDHE